MLKITTHAHPACTRLQLEGSLAGPWRDELHRQFQSAARPIQLDLAGITFMDQEGSQLIQTLVSQGATITAISHFAALMLRQESN
ncbi:MAG TPA: hypothetical protein VHM90_04875 [Phycisphaerae bacterium]|nr:hypothetical protein [Phycisphaerae bacterium]